MTEPDMTLATVLGITVMNLAALETQLIGLIGELRVVSDKEGDARYVAKIWASTTATIRKELWEVAKRHPALRSHAQGFADLAVERNLLVHGVWDIAPDGQSAMVTKPSKVKLTSLQDGGMTRKRFSVEDVVVFDERVTSLLKDTLALWDEFRA